MKRNLTALWLTFSLLAALVVACSETETDGPQTTGSGFLLSLSDGSLQVTTISGANEEPSTRTIPSELPSPVKEQFHVTILAEGGTTPLYDGPFTEQYIPAVPGRYTVSASYGSNPTLAWDTPYYSGSVSAIVEDRKPTAVTIPCAVANALVSVRFTNPSLFNQLYGEYGVIVANGDQSVRITPDKVAQSAYLPAESTDLRLTFSATLSESGNEVRFAMEGDLAERLPLGAGQHLILSLKASNTGLQIEKVEVKQENVSATIPDSWLPTPKVSGFGTINYVETNDAPTGATLSYTALRPLQDMELTFQFEDPQYSAYNKSYTLSALTEAERQELATLGLSALPQLGTTSSGSLDFAPLIATLQTNAGTTTTNAITLRVKANDRWSNEKSPATAQKVIVEKPEFSVSALPGNIWTKEFTLSALSADQVTTGKGRYAQLSTAMGYQFSTDGQNWETLGSDRRKAGLAAATTYYVRGLYRGCVPGLSCQVKTYPTTVIDGGFEEWYEQDGNNHYNFWYPYAEGASNPIWNTKNVETTVNENISYCSTSGTVPTSTCYSGAKAALIRTVGWGAGNTWTSIASLSIVYNKSIGELYLGEYNEGANYGISYDSNPTAVSFYYKYTPKDSDTGICIVELANAETNVVLSSVTTALNSASNYQKATITMPTLSRVDLPINKLSIIFKSGTHTNINKSQKRDGIKEHFGSQLWIDEVTLIYDK